MVTAAEENFLKQSLVKYYNPDKTRVDVATVLNIYKSLTARYEAFVFNDGSQKDLLNMQGTIPVTYKGTIYHIPVCIWIMDTHPQNAPLCYVRPTPDMCIKVSMYVDYNGKIYLPYLHDWQPNTSDLLSLIQVMIVTFGEKPPVYSRRNQQDSATPYPPSNMPRVGSAGPSPYLPYPAGGYTPPTNNAGYPPYPPATSASNSVPYPTSFSFGNMPFPFSPSQTPYPGQSGPNLPYPPTSGTGSIPMPNARTDFGGGNSYNQTGTISEEHIKASLMSAVEDKIRRRLREQYSQSQAEMETLRRTEQELNEGKERLDRIFAKLQREQTELEKSISVLKDKEADLQRAINRLQDQEEIDVDEAVTTTAPLYKQLLNAFAEEAATEDTIYYLDEALLKGVIDLDTFLKHVRALSRRQFMLRALMQKCRQKAGLAC
ncbi:tumor susceptibility gene 101 protein isoform X2 [Ctenocephalides felis]|uniref:tumor susceptibility gene 101 protein isoform X2 n=1 Tax=Ctenocephalides felis TaxID=7515 RepID=UPI000E6E4562|nr:tumor susceptibility gene 101 protein isoform X2 [Ctenocephalides felis]